MAVFWRMGAVQTSLEKRSAVTKRYLCSRDVRSILLRTFMSMYFSGSEAESSFTSEKRFRISVGALAQSGQADCCRTAESNALAVSAFLVVQTSLIPPWMTYGHRLGRDIQWSLSCRHLHRILQGSIEIAFLAKCFFFVSGKWFPRLNAHAHLFSQERHGPLLGTDLLFAPMPALSG